MEVSIGGSRTRRSEQSRTPRQNPENRSAKDQNAAEQGAADRARMSFCHWRNIGLSSGARLLDDSARLVYPIPRFADCAKMAAQVGLAFQQAQGKSMMLPA